MARANSCSENQSGRHHSGQLITRRYLLRLVAAGGAGLAVQQLLAACQPAATPPAKTEQPGAAPPLKVTPVAELEGIVAPTAALGQLPAQTIVVAVFSGPEADAHKRLAPKFEEYTKGKVKVVLEDLGRPPALDQKFMAVLMAKSDAWDVIYSNSRKLPANVESGFFVPLKSFMDDPQLFNAKAYDLQDFPEGTQNLQSYKGKLYGFMQEIAIILVAYRKDLLDKYGIKAPPASGWTWEGLRDVCLVLKDKLKADGQPADVFPLSFGVKGPLGAQQAIHAFWGNGVEWFDEVTQMPKFYQPGAVEALKFTTDLVWKDQIVSPGLTDYAYMEVLTAFQQGKAAIALQWVGAAPTWNNKSQSPVTAGKTGYTVYPTFSKKAPNFMPGYAAGTGIAVSAFSKKQKAAFEYLVWFTSKEVARDYVVNGGGVSGRASLLGDPKILETLGEHMTAHGNQLKALHRWPDTPESDWIESQGLAPSLNAMWTKMASIDDALKQADKNVIDYYRQKGYLK